MGGNLTADGEVPWQCSLLNGNNQWTGCGAVLLSCSPSIVLSAAHCLGGPITGLQVACGTNVRTWAGKQKTQHEQRLQVSEVIRHPRYNRPRNANDIAVLKFSDGDEFSCKELQLYPACLPSKGEDYEGWTKGMVTGWGRTAEGGPVSTTLMKARLPIRGDGECNTALGGGVDADTMICAGKDKIDACQGDSGGPLAVQDNLFHGWSLVGLVSWGVGCGRRGLYGVYTEVSHYIPWIAQQYNLSPPDGWNRYRNKGNRNKKNRRKGRQ